MSIYTDETKKQIAKRLNAAKTRILSSNPFYGALLMRLKFALSECGTACTNMEKIFFDPDFIEKLSDEELDFILMHEVLHCALDHIRRGKDRHHYLYNIATDIVVNSNIMMSLRKRTFCILGEEVMHTAPSGIEGYYYSAEDVYEMLVKKYGNIVEDAEKTLAAIEEEFGVSIDKHDIWETIPMDSTYLYEKWKAYLIDAAKYMGNHNLPSGVRKMLNTIEKESKLNWRVLLQDYVKTIYDKYDYSFQPPDRRFSTGKYILPSYGEIEEQEVNNIWFLIDSSGSVSDELLEELYSEIRAAIRQFEDHLSGKLSFFDTRVTEPIAFDSVQTLNQIKPQGGGGTSFICMFQYMKEKMKVLPSAIIIITDGEASFPAEDVAMGVPVLWVFSSSREKKAPWGASVCISNC